MDLQPLLVTLHKVSMERIPVWVELTEQDDLHIARIPVLQANNGDKAEQALRRYAADWLKRMSEERIGVDTKFEKAAKGQFFFNDQNETFPLYGCIILTWWPKPPPEKDDEPEGEAVTH